MSTPLFFQSFLAQERTLFSKVISAVPDDGLDYRADPKARTARQLIAHLLGHNLDLQELVDDGIIHHRFESPFTSVEDAVRQLDESFAALIQTLDTLDEEQWARACQFRAGDQLIMEGPCQQLAWMMLLDSIHHRGQLSTYLRPMGSTVPAIYGPSADDAGEGH